jgi:nucleoid-associated protein YgaU
VRPGLASPVPSPSTIALVSTTPSATASQVAGETYEVQSGDTLLSIAQQYYSDPSQWQRIYDANKDTIGSDPNKLSVGMKLTIPPKQS